jgi:UDP-N-acetylglucosamine 1-carboxyvinyltransferase
LRGEVAVSGAKNAALPILAATLLFEDQVALENVPHVGDVQILADVLRGLGVQIDGDAGGALHAKVVDTAPHEADRSLVERMRASFCVLGPLLARRGRAVVPLPGGCRIGPRPVDLHLRGLTALGAKLRIEAGRVIATASRLRGAAVDLRGPRGTTVTGTANLLSAAVLAEGKTVIRGAALEPEIVDLGRFLQSAGADIEGVGTGTILVRGVRELHPVQYRVVPDRIEAATLLLAGLVTGGEVQVRGARPEHLTAVLGKLQAAGARLTIEVDRITATASDRLNAMDLVTSAFPGVPTDVQPQWTALAALARGTSRLRDDVFPERWGHLAALARFGAAFSRTGAVVRVYGRRRLMGAHVEALDLRGGAALLLAALAADGESTIAGFHHVDRGYERLVEKISQLGGRLSRLSAC